MKVTIELDFENEPTRDEVYSYLVELMEDKTLEWRKESVQPLGEPNSRPLEWGLEIEKDP